MSSRFSSEEPISRAHAEYVNEEPSYGAMGMDMDELRRLAAQQLRSGVMGYGNQPRQPYARQESPARLAKKAKSRFLNPRQIAALMMRQGGTA